MKTLWKNSKRKSSLLNMAAYVGVAILCVTVIILLSRPVVDSSIKERILKAVTREYPGYSMAITRARYNILTNTVECDSVVLSKNDSTFTSSASRIIVNGTGLIDVLFREEELVPQMLACSTITTQGLVMNFPKSGYEVRCGQVHCSLTDSEMTAENISLSPFTDDAHFFSSSKFRKPRLRLAISRLNVTGLDCAGLLQDKEYRAHSVDVHDGILDCLLNKEKPVNGRAAYPVMPNEFLFSIKKMVAIDTISIIDGEMKYGERYVNGGEVAQITVNNIHATVEGVTNHAASDKPLVVAARANFMKTGAMKLLLVIPAASKKFSYRYSGSLGTFDLPKINPFLTVSEQWRISAGILKKASFDILVTNGQAKGTVREEYSDLDIGMSGKSSGGIIGGLKKIGVFIVKNIVIRRNNKSFKSGAMKLGDVNYTRKPDQTFLEFSWFALRNGISDVVGLGW